jgi:hypothetical protein
VWYLEIEAMNPPDKESKRSAIPNENGDEDFLHSIRKEAHKRFSLRIVYFWRRLRETRSLDEFLNKESAGLKVIQWYFRR